MIYAIYLQVELRAIRNVILLYLIEKKEVNRNTMDLLI
jgi:hypothetical protein